MVLNPLGHDHVASFAYMVEASAVLEELVAGATRSAALDLDDKLTWSDGGDSGCRAPSVHRCKVLRGHVEGSSCLI